MRLQPRKDKAYRPFACSLTVFTACFCLAVQELSISPKEATARAKKFFSLKKDRLSDIVPRFVVVDGLEKCVTDSRCQAARMILPVLLTYAPHKPWNIISHRTVVRTAGVHNPLRGVDSVCGCRLQILLG